MKLSVLDLVPVRADQTSSQALQATLALARVADETGYERYWLAEHHNMPAIASTNPAVLIGLVASATGRIRVGSGGVMLPNHAPLVVAEQFALLEAAFPDRVDLGIGRAPGTDPVTNWALRHGGPAAGDEGISHFDQYVANVIAMLSPAGVGLDIAGRQHILHATPAAERAPQVWLLGSSDYSAHLAARLGLPYVFAHHFAGRGTAEALALYRREFTPSEYLEAPRTFLTVNAAVAPTDEEAERWALPQLLSMVALRTGQPLRPLLSIEQAEAVGVPAAHQPLAESMRSQWIIADPAGAVGRLSQLAAEFDVDEVMINPIAGAYEGTDPATSPNRDETLRLLAAEVFASSGAGRTSAVGAAN